MRDVGGLSNEARQRLREVRPETLGQAARIPGLTPAAVSLLLVHLKKRDRALEPGARAMTNFYDFTVPGLDGSREYSRRHCAAR